MNAVDTNILFYAQDPRDPKKQNLASAVISSLYDGALLWQVACEYLWATRKLEPLGYSAAQAIDHIRDLRLVWSTILPDWTVLDRTDELRAKHGLSFWDSLIVAACIEGGVERLFSEDFGDHTSIESVETVNPFKRSKGWKTADGNHRIPDPVDSTSPPTAQPSGEASAHNVQPS